MKMKTHILAGMLAAALLAGGCGKFVRDELITMQNEIDLLYTQVDQMNKGLKTLQDIVRVMAANGYIVNVEEFEAEDGSGYILSFRTVTLDENGNVSSDDSFSIPLYSGVDGTDGLDAEPYVVSMKKDTEEDGSERWYWWHADEDGAVDEEGNPLGEWLVDDQGERIPVDGRTPTLDIKEGLWIYTLDGEHWVEPGWPAKGVDALEYFSGYTAYDDHVELTLAADGSVLVLPRFLPVDVALTVNGEEVEDSLLAAPGETVTVHYVLSGTGAENAVLVAGTDGRLKTAIRVDAESALEGDVDVTCPAEFPEGGYVYITVYDGNGRSDSRIIRFTCRTLNLLFGDAEYDAPAAGETGRMLTFEANFELDAACVFPEGVEPWLTAKTEIVEGIPVLTYDIAENTAAEARTGVIVVCPKDHPGFEMFRVTVNQAAAEAGTGTGNEGTGTGNEGTGTGNEGTGTGNEGTGTGNEGTGTGNEGTGTGTGTGTDEPGTGTGE